MHALLGVQDHVAWWQECLRAVVIFVFGFVMVRASGRRSFAKWSALDIIVSILIGSTLSRALTGEAPLWGTLAASVVIMAAHLALAHVAARSRLFAALLEGTPVPLARDGELDQGKLRRDAISEIDLSEALRQSGVPDLAGTKLVTLEASGKITVLKPR